MNLLKPTAAANRLAAHRKPWLTKPRLFCDGDWLLTEASAGTPSAGHIPAVRRVEGDLASPVAMRADGAGNSLATSTAEGGGRRSDIVLMHHVSTVRSPEDPAKASANAAPENPSIDSGARMNGHSRFTGKLRVDPGMALKRSARGRDSTLLF